MKKLIIIILSIIFFIGFSKKELINQQKEEEISKPDSLSNYFLFDYIQSLTAEDYTVKLDSIKNGKSNDFFTLRMAYTKTKDYSPYETDISDSLKKVHTLIDSSQFGEALSILEYIQEHNFVNISSHLYSGYIYKELGDSIKSDFHYTIYEGLLNSIYESGDGVTHKTAYIVITTKEEYAFLGWFGLQFNEQSLISLDGYSFDLMKVTDPNTREKHEIYFNIELAFDVMRKTFGE